MTIAILGICFCVVLDETGFPVIHHDVFSYPVTLRCTWNKDATDWGEPIPERHQGFDIIVNGIGKIGEILTQYKKIDEEFGTHLRIRHIEIQAAHRNRGYGAKAMSLIEDVFQGVPLKLEVSEFDRAWHLYERLGYIKKRNLEGFGDDVEIWVKNMVFTPKQDMRYLRLNTIRDEDGIATIPSAMADQLKTILQRPDCEESYKTRVMTHLGLKNLISSGNDIVTTAKDIQAILRL